MTSMLFDFHTAEFAMVACVCNISGIVKMQFTIEMLHLESWQVGLDVQNNGQDFK